MQVVGAVARSPDRPATVEELTVPPPGPGEVVVRIQASGVCHSDLHFAAGRSEAATRSCSATRAPESWSRWAPA